MDGPGYVEIGSPLRVLVEAWAKVLLETPVLDWGGTALRVEAVDLVESPSFESGRGRFRTATPVVMKGSGRGPDGVRTTRQAFLVPSDVEWPGYFAQSLRRKAESLGLDADVALEAITWVGPRRSMATAKGHKPGAAVEVDLSGAPETLRALWSWGLGQATSAGFGWVVA
ncbi:CRISPR-associated endoribonuclease Cas6 [Frankia sp. AgKG'84/4]|uniref:CRISPR-associated endoribonuclease Cas6 n=1 Tax=Frankia sp. AgKG'84/4 TaxID=573490 RepID=UPI002010229A|nr:CRISPR-associated endoribonuclease Cas6 [Frankia sp. AgKG'84/4]MCL9793800.1 hypothetical protein [Frankia sp. AgKG'84/4]